jgi:hypothetical protein
MSVGKPISDDFPNASDSIRINRESDSNEIDESDSQSKKRDDPRIPVSKEIVSLDGDAQLRIN